MILKFVITVLNSVKFSIDIRTAISFVFGSFYGGEQAFDGDTARVRMRVAFL
jgi:hypothetical protein